MKRLLTTLAAACAVWMCGCDTAGRSYMTEIRSGVWSEPVEIGFTNTDTLGLCDLSIALRHDGSLEGGRVAMTVRTVTPDSLWFEEQFAMTLAHDGRSRSAQHESAALYRRSVRFARTGGYRITVAPLRPVKGITAVGIDISENSAKE